MIKWTLFGVCFVALVASFWVENLAFRVVALLALLVAAAIVTRPPRRPRVPDHPTRHTRDFVGRIQLTNGCLKCGGAPDFRRGPSLELRTLRTDVGDVEIVATVSHRGSLRRVTEVDLVFHESVRCDEASPSVVVEGGVLAVAAPDRLQPIKSKDYLRALYDLDDRSWHGDDPWLLLGDEARPWCVILMMAENSIYPLRFETWRDRTTVTIAEG